MFVFRIGFRLALWLSLDPACCVNTHDAGGVTRMKRAFMVGTGIERLHRLSQKCQRDPWNHVPT